MIYCIYFFISAAQIRFGWPESDETQILKSAGQTNKILSATFYAIPFLWEVKAIQSWLWTKTSFDLFQWIKFEEIYSSLFVTKCNAKLKAQKVEGAETDKTLKRVMGGCGLFILICLLVAPIILFSSLNPMKVLNNPYKATMRISLGYRVDETFDLFYRGNAKILNLTSEELGKLNVRAVPEFRSQTDDQFSWIGFSNSSDYNSLPSIETRNMIIEYFTWYMEDSIQLTFTFQRHVTSYIYNI